MSETTPEEFCGITFQEWGDAPLPPAEYHDQARAWLGGCYGARSGAKNPYNTAEPSRAWEAGHAAQTRTDSLKGHPHDR